MSNSSSYSSLSPLRTLLLLGIFILCLLAPRIAGAQENQVIYDDDLRNGWGDRSWAKVDYSATGVVHGGSKSISVDSSPYSALFVAHGPMDTKGYDTVSFWIHGGPQGGQDVKLVPIIDDKPGTAYPLGPLAADTWKQFTIPLSTLGLGDTSTSFGFQFGNSSGDTLPTFYVDDIVLNAKVIPPPDSVNVAVDAQKVLGTIDDRIYGINFVAWDSRVNTSATSDALKEMNTRIVRIPGGSWSDDYDWSRHQMFQKHSELGWTHNNAGAFALLIEKQKAQAMVTVNYGNGTPQMAAAWVAYYNGSTTSKAPIGVDVRGTDWQTVGYWAQMRAASPLPQDDGYNQLRIAHPAPFNFKQWEVGNECFGNWEHDEHGTTDSVLTGTAHDPATYALYFKQFQTQMKAVSPEIKVGAVATTTDETYTWTKPMLAAMKDEGVMPDFLIYHLYMGSGSDFELLQASSRIVKKSADLRQQLNDAFGEKQAAPIELAMTEINADNGKTTTSLVNSLFMADAITTMATTDFKACVWWALRSGADKSKKDTSSRYGWRLFGDHGVIAPDDSEKYPTFYSAKMLTHWGRGGDSVVAATSDYNGLGVHAAKLRDGSLALLFLNKHSDADLKTEIKLDHFTPKAVAAVYQYGKPNDTAQQDLTVGSIKNVAGTFTCVFPPLSMTIIVIKGNASK